MKIIYYFEEKDTLMYKWQTFHIFDELKKYGIDIEIFNPLDYSSVSESNEKLLKNLEGKKIDLFITACNEKKIYIETLERIKSKGIPTLLICFDNLVIPFEHKKICDSFDLVWLTSKETESMFKKWGAKTIFLPYAANPFFFRPKEEKEINKIAFIGTPYGSRVNTLNALINSNISVSLHSNITKSSGIRVEKQDFKDYIKPFYNLIRFKFGRKIILGAMKQKILTSKYLDINAENLDVLNPVQLKDLGALYSKYSLSLSSTAARNTGVLKTPLNIVNLRSFEIPMSGGLQICPYFKELAEYFEEDKEIIFYRNEKELIDKTRFYLRPENKKIRQQMKKAARSRAEKDHTWFNRFKQIFDYFGLEYNGEIRS